MPERDLIQNRAYTDDQLRAAAMQWLTESVSLLARVDQALLTIGFMSEAGEVAAHRHSLSTLIEDIAS